MPSLFLTANPRDLKPPTLCVVGDPLTCLFAPNTAHAWRGEVVASTPPLADIGSYIDVAHEEFACINEMVVVNWGGDDSEECGYGGSGSEGSGGRSWVAGAGAGASVDADKTGLDRVS